MVDIKWFKFEVNMHDDTKLKIIDNMDERDSVHYMWIRLLALAGKTNCGGNLYINDNMPYTIKTLAIEFNRSIDEVKTAIKALKRLEMIEFTEDKAFKIKNWDKHQNVEGLERLRNLNSDRVAKHRAKKKEKNEDVNNVASELDEGKKPIENSNEDSDEANDGFEKTNDIYNSNNRNLKENSVYNADNYIKNNCNVRSNDITSNCNITVMEQKKIENKIKKKMEMEKNIESKSDIESNNEDDSSLITFSNSSDSKEIIENKVVFFSGKSVGNPSEGGQDYIGEKDRNFDYKQNNNTENENINNQALAKLLMHHQSITGIIGGLNLGSLKLAISMHGYENVKMAINKALEVNKSNMTYINGILKNWRREGYPNEKEVNNNGVRSAGKSKPADKNEFGGFKPKKPRNLTEAERKGAEEKLI